MKTLVFAISFAFAALLCGGAVTIPASAQQSSMSSGNMTGDWAVQATGPKFIVGKLHLTQVGNTIVGSGVSANGNGVLQINGQLQDGKISGKWRGPTGETGWITLIFEGSSAFNGEWGYGGRNPSGKIVAKKLMATSF